MKIRLIMTGKTSDKWLKEGIEQYFGRISRYLPFDVKVIPDIKNAGKMSAEAVKQQEGEAILRSVDNSDRMVLLDENGKMLSSREFAGFIEKQMISGCRHLVFVIGGAWGVSEEVVRRADQKISLSPMTFSHQMVRLVFAEQLYRAMSIINNEPYHHD
ncbi:MAG: 23S rRNA (pseudouridine(1915)-N(3))-methyltransferase RlmH [Marinilabiliaceae bacterium]